MGIIKNIINAFGRATEVTEDEIRELRRALKEDRRRHARYPINFDGALRISVSNGLVGEVKDISFSGMSAAFRTDEPVTGEIRSIAKSDMAWLMVLDQSAELPLEHLRSGRKNDELVFAAFGLQDAEPAALIFLRDVLKHLAFGESLEIIDKRNIAERYQGDEWYCLRGEGPTDLMLKLTDDLHSLDEALLTWPGEHMGYCEVRYRNGRITTGQTIEDFGPGARVATNNSIVAPVLRQALCILLGIHESALQKMVVPMIEQGILELDMKAGSGAA